VTLSADTRNHSAPNSKLYASIAADTDLGAEYPLATAGKLDSYKLPRQIIVHGSGDLSYENENGDTVTVPVTAPYTYDITPRKLLAATDATNILVLW
jgi:D-alanyl-D-alanine carboxypeptidase